MIGTDSDFCNKPLQAAPEIFTELNMPREREAEHWLDAAAPHGAWSQCSAPPVCGLKYTIMRPSGAADAHSVQGAMPCRARR